jgi:hypothetical protein
MTLVFLGILRNQALYTYPQLLDQVITAVLLAAISCCIAWGIVDGIFYAWENHALAARKNLIVSYTRNPQQKVESLKMIKEDLQYTYINLLNEDEQEFLYEKIAGNLAEVEMKEKVPLKDDVITIFLDFCLNVGACLVIISPLVLLRNVVSIGMLVNLAVVIAIVLMFMIGVWAETRKSVLFKATKGATYAALGAIITVLTYLLGG